MDTRNVDWVSHKDYLDSCDYDDLKNLQRFIRERVNKIESEEEVILYFVEGPNYIEGWFDNYEDAFECLSTKVLPKLRSENHVGDSVGIDYKRVAKSEVKNYLEEGGW